MEVNDERDRRIRSHLDFNGVVYDFDERSKANITGAATLAGFAIGAGLGTDPYWHVKNSPMEPDPVNIPPFVWSARDNSNVPMDANTVFMFGKAAANRESAHIFAAKAIKLMSPIPLDYTDDKYWP